MGFWSDFFKSNPSITEEEIVEEIHNQVNKVQPEITNKNWREGMWVVPLNGDIGILHRLGDPCEVHIVNTQTGETAEIIQIPISGLRQATWNEIPECRRCVSKEAGEALGYGS